jgi:hypothetical protein
VHDEGDHHNIARGWVPLQALTCNLFYLGLAE